MFFLKSFLKRKKGLSLFIDYWQEDNYGRIIGIKLPKEIKQTLKGLITSLSPFEMRDLIESIRKSSDEVPEAYIEFLGQNPTAEEILDYSRNHSEAFLESIEKSVLNIKKRKPLKYSTKNLKGS